MRVSFELDSISINNVYVRRIINLVVIREFLLHVRLQKKERTHDLDSYLANSLGRLIIGHARKYMY